ncbi:MAG: energy transducer TonB [Nitrospinae bacterium]|nr:energy transducer TonB [Nitrospinota bacterium]MCG2813054.1 energy transducer TonB [Thermodesulfovibrionales bacterium]
MLLRGNIGTMKEQSYGIMTSISIHTIAIVIFLMLTINKGSNDLKTFYIQFTQMGEHTVQAPPAVREIKKHKVTEPSRKEIKEETPLIKEPPVKEHEAVIRTDAIESHEVVNVASAPEPAPQVTHQQGGESTVSNVSFSASSGTTSVIETEFGARGAPAFLKRQMPVYPMMAKRLGKQGKVVLRLFINEKGRLMNVEVVESAGYGFTESAMEGVKMSTFSPAHENGVGIASKALLSIRFVLKRN